MDLTPDERKKYNHAQLEFLREVGRDLTQDAQTGKIKTVVGREQEIQLMIEVLCRETKSNPVLVGGAGVGKTALVEGLAIKIYREQVPEKLRGCRLFSVASSSLIAGSNWYGMIETRIKHLLEEARRDKIIVFIDEIHTIVGTSPDQDSTRDIGQQLKPALARGEIKLIGATTDDEYRRFIETDEALERRFQPIRVPELSTEQTFGILKKLADDLASKNKIEIGENILRVVLTYGERFLRNRHFPDKAIDLLEQTVAYAESKDKNHISAEDARQVVQRLVGMPLNLHKSLQNLSENLTGKELLDEVQARQFCDFLRISMQGLNVSPERPNAVVFLLGESANKTKALAETIAEDLFSSENCIIKLDFADLNERWEFNQMLGIESGLRRQSTDAPVAKISQIPWCIIVCEGLEKSGFAIQELWARAIENGYLTDAKNKKIYLSDSIIIISADIDVSPKGKMGFSNSVIEKEDKRLEKFFSKSLLKFADFVIAENIINSQNLRRRWLKENLHNNLSKRFRRQGIYLHWDKSIIESLLQKLEQLNEEQDWERLVNFHALPALLPFLEQTGKRLSVTVSCKSDVIKIETVELSENAKEQIKLEESLKRELYSKIESWLKGLFYIEKEEDFSMMTVYDATTKVDIYFSLWKEQLLVSFLTPVAENIHTDAGLLQYLLEKNMVLRFGKFAFETGGAVWLEYSMFGEHCGAKSFLSALRTITENARNYKQELKKRESAAITSQWLNDEAAEWLESKRFKKVRNKL